MLPELKSLLELQVADREILRLNEEIAALPKRVEAIEEKLAGTKAILEKAKGAVKADEAARRKYESTIQDLRQKISKYRDQMLDVKTNEQYKALQHEVNFAEQEIGVNEDKILELMINAESRDKEVKAAEADLKEETAEIEKEKADARQKTAEDEKLLGEWNTKRDAFRTAVPADLLRHYDRVVKLRKTGLSEVRDHKCMACQVMLRPQTYNEVRAGAQVVICDSCQRILYFDSSKEAPVERPVGPAKKRHHPRADAPQAWIYRPDYPEHGEVLIALINEKDSASRRIFDFNTGRQLGDILVREGDYRLAFPEDLSGDYIRLNGSWDEEEIETWGEEVPMVVLDSLHADLQAARAEAGSKNHARQEQAVS
ncbi:MAG TPA: C4-type zinc ribbon domain-containing protein [Terriglobales bacterium]|nr:C4-type zinc ribbon domain-containing protein [Terriglobales bacterium]